MIAAELPDPEQLAQKLLDTVEATAEACAVAFDAMLPRVVERIVGPGAPTEAALASGGMVLNDLTVAMRLNRETDTVEFFCDVGLPRSHAREDCYRVALELNLCRAYQGLTFGLHPDSGRLVATTAMHALMIGSDEVCINTLHMLTQVVGEVRHARLFDLDG